MKGAHLDRQGRRRTYAGVAAGAGAPLRLRQFSWANPIVRCGDHPSPAGGPDVAVAIAGFGPVVAIALEELRSSCGWRGSAEPRR
jgi:hypothetical protein